MMNKVLAFLEKHVQWIALGLGALYLGYMIWIYALQTPVMVIGVGPTPLTPGEVDPMILQSAALPLDNAMKDTNVPEMEVPNFIDKFKGDMDFTSFIPYALDWNVDSQTVSIQLIPASAVRPEQEAQINALPTLPPTSVDAFSSGRSNIQPFAAVAAGNNPGVQLVAGGLDKCWVSAGYRISPSELAKAFKAANIPPWTEHTTILKIELWRQEALPGGKWSDAKLITPINAALMQPFPAKGDTAADQAYVTWAVAHVSDILQPAFYQVNKGDPWHAPGTTINVVSQPVARAALDPNQTYPLSVLEQYSKDERQAYFSAHNKLKPSQPRSGGRSGPPSGPPPGFSPGPGGGAVNQANPPMSQTGVEIDADVIPGAPGYMPPGMMPPGMMPPGMMGPPGMPPPNVSGGAASPDLASQFPIPPGDFDPNAVTDIAGWAHDDTAEPGHTYHYMIKYSIKNPIFGTNAAKNKPELAAVFDIQSPDGPWSKPINVATTTNFFVASNSRPGASNARFKVYKWQDGVERSKGFEVAPGDIIGGKDGDVDFSTGWTVVDLRFDDPHNPDSMTILVMDPNGIIDRRDYRTDQAKPELKALDQQLSSATPADQLAKQP